MTAKNKPQTAAQLLVRSLMQQKVKQIFGIPGGKIMSTFDVLNDEGPDLIMHRALAWRDFTSTFCDRINRSEDRHWAIGCAPVKRRFAQCMTSVELPLSAEFLKTNFEDRVVNEKIKAARVNAVRPRPRSVGGTQDFASAHPAPSLNYFARNFSSKL